MERIALAAALAALLCGAPGAAETGNKAEDNKPLRRIEWEKIQIDGGAYESAGVFDINRDGRLDIVAPGKEGLYLFRNRGPEKTGTK